MINDYGDLVRICKYATTIVPFEFLRNGNNISKKITFEGLNIEIIDEYENNNIENRICFRYFYLINENNTKTKILTEEWQYKYLINTTEDEKYITKIYDHSQNLIIYKYFDSEKKNQLYVFKNFTISGKTYFSNCD